MIYLQVIRIVIYPVTRLPVCLTMGIAARIMTNIKACFPINPNIPKTSLHFQIIAGPGPGRPRK